MVIESTSGKKHHSIAYHRCREASATETIQVAKEGTKTNLADLFIKSLSQDRKTQLLERFVYYLKVSAQLRVSLCYLEAPRCNT